MFEKKDKVNRNLNEQLDAKQRLIEKLQQNDISSKEVSNKLETLEIVLSPDCAKSAIRLEKSVTFFLGY